MIQAIDFRIFGNGRGLAAPFWSTTFYWLVDAHTERGTFYHWSGWYGAQLASFQWTHPKPQERRMLAGVDFRPFNSSRSWGRVRVSWTMDPKSAEQIEAFRDELRCPRTGYYR